MPQNQEYIDRQGTIQFKDGYDTSSMGPQLKPYDMKRLAVIEAAKKRPFTQMSMVTKIKPNSGDELKRYREYPILHDKNMNDQGLDANGAVLLKDKWYAYKADGSRVVKDTEKEAREVAGVVKVLKGGGALYAGSRDFALQNDNFPRIGEIGGQGNRVGLTREVLTAKANKYAITLEYTSDALKFDTQTQLNVKYSREIGRAYAELREAITRNGLIQNGLLNATYCGSATSLAEIDETCGLTYQALRRMQTSLDIARCPFDTKVITGSTKIDTVTVSSARYVYVPVELEAEIEDLTHNGRLMFSDFASYADAAGKKYAEGEFGKAGKFRFISDFDFPLFKGVGADAADGDDADGDGVEDAGAEYSITNGRYDAAALLFVGSESFEVVTTEKGGFELFESAPKVITGVDNYADVGSVSVKWRQGILINKPEWIRCLVCAFKA